MFVYDPKVELTRFEDEIVEFEKQPVKKGLIMLYGSSNFTRWSEKYGNVNAEDVLLGKDGRQAVVNHGFGGATSEEMLYYYPRAVRPWAPRALVLSTYGNGMGKGYMPFEKMFIQARIMDYARREFSGIKFFLCNAAPDANSKNAKNQRKVAIAEYNELCADYCRKHDDAYLVDRHGRPEIYDSPDHIGEYDHIRDELFIEDKTHFTPEGYELYRQFMLKALEPVL